METNTSFYFYPTPKLFALILYCLFFLSPPLLLAKEANQDDWSLHFQATGINQTHPAFRSNYAGKNSLNSNAENRETVTSTIFLGRRLWKGGEFYINPEISQGKGFSNTLGIAGFTDGEATHAGKMESSLFERSFFWNNVARLFLRQTFDLSDKYETVESDQNQLAGTQATSRIVVTVGKMSATDIFDNNNYSHDARTQFLNWGLITNGAWDYPADAKGYTNGLTVEYIQPDLSIRWGDFMTMKTPNSSNIDSHLWQGWGQVLEFEKPYNIYEHPGKLRILGFLNRARMGKYEIAADSSMPDISQSRKYRFKYGSGINIEQEITKDLGAFMRFGWNDGQTESWAYTEIDRTCSLGLSLKGTMWSRSNDTVGLAYLINWLSSDHKKYLEAGGNGFLIGDGRLRYSSENIIEFYYNLNIIKGLLLTFDYQFINNPAYNEDRGPVSVFSGRINFQI